MLCKLFAAVSIICLPALMHAQTDTKTTQNTPHPNIDYKQIGAPLPPFMFMSYNDTSLKGAEAANLPAKYTREVYKTRTGASGAYTFLTGADFDKNAPLFVMMFNPTCNHCEDVAFMLEKNIDLFKKTRIVMLANKLMTDYLPDFAHRHHIGSYPAMYIGYDSTNFIDNTFLYQSLPQINIYGPGHKLVKTYTGEVSIDLLKEYIDLTK